MSKLNRPILRNQPCYWITGRKKDGKMALLGPYDLLDQEKAESDMYDSFPNDTGKLHLMNSRNRQLVTSQLKYILFSESRDLDSSMANISHIK